MESGKVVSLSNIPDISQEGKEMMRSAMEEAYLLYFNRYLYSHGTISKAIYHRMDLAIKTKKHKRGERK